MQKFSRAIGALLGLVVLVSGCKPEADLTPEQVLETLPEEGAMAYRHNAKIADFLDRHLPLPHHDESWVNYEARMKEQGIVFDFGLPHCGRASSGNFGPRDRLVVGMCDGSRERIRSVSFDGYNPDLADAVLADGLVNGFMTKDPLNADDIEYGLVERFAITKKYMVDEIDKYPGMMKNLAGFVTFFREDEDGGIKRFVTSSRYFTC